ncbi:uncharacterized protein [Physcomitrium patens]|uniref:Protein kinase domain-containing protein n=1 Tax=Physcomitrium patens TaxID=3218 RepID=A9RED8_PHYPA|nr:uncharacterized protein LOC112293830 isoform X1 [Physcomitrium patens]XP_024399482.1 uncharacterized protein LOC112293830 isoform X1 [Physcomitrium patens]XP_024399483.1 uncharacterized protein LOC112293830 isoform X1 [Physcomitrium patens]XP_024399484.1 uncharacterized protein LOC112293830 isoform X1 [Physcomitrium patens]XP_024399485.1 uncharacterized protein LOC112293830 isoform X1 [Physcomitrium patens]XP_024399486.1 uncharacterized protein LOC112293830 isoform X1 [Physcomitrium patens]|eukprot:XP_024399481.1 uncharacterized protein LOC112293830 isoform X1 [Physcomitrella patens]
MEQHEDCIQDIGTISNIQGIGGDLWKECQEYVRALEVLLKEKDILNRNQCENQYKKVENVMKVFECLLGGNSNGLEYGPLLSELYIVLNKAYLLVKSCGEDNWCEVAIFQMKNKETFREVLWDLKNCCDVASEMLVKHNPNKFEVNMSGIFDVSTCDDVEDDEKYLLKRLILESEEHFQKNGLAQHLLQRLKDLDCMEGGNLDALKLSSNIKSLKIIDHISEGAYGEVYKSNWLGIDCAVKKMDVGYDKLFMKEVGILASLSHPNLIKYFFAMKGNAKESGECWQLKTKETRKLYLGMELMQTSLSEMIEKNGELSYVFLIDIMYQIARGMCYLHDMHIAHRGLKPDNILLNIKEKKISNRIVQHATVKVIDFGMSKIEVGSNPKATNNKHVYGSANYMAPEVLKNKSQTMTICPFEADVYLFVMVCCKMFFKKDPFYDANTMKKILERIENGERPNLPSNCDELTRLIKECWSLNPLQRPKFVNICERLIVLKRKFIAREVQKKAPCFGASKEKSHPNIELQPQLDRLPLISFRSKYMVDEVEEEVFGRTQHLAQIRELCASNMKALCLVGMGGIGKTTIAKATLNSVKHMYDASCFVECIESGGDCYKMCCNILEQLEGEKMPKDLKDAQEMLKSVLTKKKVILVFDNVKNKRQVEDVVSMDDIFASNGSTLIMTTRDWKIMEHCDTKICMVNVEELDEETSLRLFVTYSCGFQDKLPHELVEVGKKIVKACNGLPLSLKVMGAFLREKKRLRYWERALQRLKRGRELDRDEENSDHKIWNILRVSFDNLKVEEKNMFLDICCFFCNDVCSQGMLKERAIRVWTRNKEMIYEEDIEYILNTLMHQSLVKVYKYGIIRMHDQPQDMGRNIVEMEMEYKDTRMWNMNVETFHGIS